MSKAKIRVSETEEDRQKRNQTYLDIVQEEIPKRQHFTDALLRTTLTRSHSTNSFLVKFRPGTFWKPYIWDLSDPLHKDKPPSWRCIIQRDAENNISWTPIDKFPESERDKVRKLRMHPQFDKLRPGLDEKERLRKEREKVEGVSKQPETGDGEAEPRSARINSFIEAGARHGTKITRKDIWTAAGYTEQTEFLRFQKNNPKTTGAAIRNFERVLAMNPEAFISLKKAKSKK